MRRASMLRLALASVVCGVPLPKNLFAAEPNVIPLVVRTPHGGFNRMVVSVIVCRPETDRCATIDDVMVDTGSTGLRLEASAMPAGLDLPPVLGPGGTPLAECLRFVHDTAWGPLVRADVRFGGLVARELPVQVIDDLGGPQPAACPTSDVRPTSNGTLGIGPHLFDCSGACRQSPQAPDVYEGDSVGWLPLSGPVDEAYRLPNPVSRLPGHDNGIVIDLPSPPGGGSKQVTGTLTFGVGTADNNRLDRAEIVRLDAESRFTTVFHGQTFSRSTVDSGTETYLFDDDRLPRCEKATWAYCARPGLQFDAEMIGGDETRARVHLTIGDAVARREQHVGASDDVAEAASHSSAFVWGAPFFPRQENSACV